MMEAIRWTMTWVQLQQSGTRKPSHKDSEYVITTDTVCYALEQTAIFSIDELITLDSGEVLRERDGNQRVNGKPSPVAAILDVYLFCSSNWTKYCGKQHCTVGEGCYSGVPRTERGSGQYTSPLDQVHYLE